MGNLRGHVVYGAGFSLVGLWHLISHQPLQTPHSQSQLLHLPNMVLHFNNQILGALLHHGRLRRSRLHGPRRRAAPPPHPRRVLRALHHRPIHLRLRILHIADGENPSGGAGEGRAEQRRGRGGAGGGAACVPLPLGRPRGGGGAVPPPPAGRDRHGAGCDGAVEHRLRPELLSGVCEVGEHHFSRGVVGEHGIHVVDSEVDFRRLFYELGEGFFCGEV